MPKKKKPIPPPLIKTGYSINLIFVYFFMLSTHTLDTRYNKGRGNFATESLTLLRYPPAVPHICNLAKKIVKHGYYKYEYLDSN